MLFRGDRNAQGYEETDIEIAHRREPDPFGGPASRTRRQRPTNRDGTYDEVAIREPHNRRHSASDLRDEASFYNRAATDNAHIGEAYNGATRDWNIVDVPPGTKRLTMDGAGGASQEISWQRYNGVRRSKFLPSGADYYDSEALQQPSQAQGSVARRYVGPKDKRDELWTEITKDLVVKEALEREGHEYEETENFFYVFSYMQYVCLIIFPVCCPTLLPNSPIADYCFLAIQDDVAHLVRISDDFRRARRDRIREIQHERATLAEPPPRAPALPAPEPPSVFVDRGAPRPRENDRFYEREVVTDEVRGPSRLSYTIEP